MGNVSQTRKQFELLYGDKKNWSKTTKAGYDHLFNGDIRSYASMKQNITVQTLGHFLKMNKIKHHEMSIKLEEAIAYREAGEQTEGEENADI